MGYIIIGGGVLIATVRFTYSRITKSSKKLVYYNLRKYTIKHKKMDKSVNDAAKGMF